MWLQFQQQQTLAAQALANQVQPDVPRPLEVGGVIDCYGFWTGFGLNGDGKAPRTTDCMHNISEKVSRNLQQLVISKSVVVVA